MQKPRVQHLDSAELEILSETGPYSIVSPFSSSSVNIIANYCVIGQTRRWLEPVVLDALAQEQLDVFTRYQESPSDDDDWNGFWVEPEEVKSKVEMEIPFNEETIGSANVPVVVFTPEGTGPFPAFVFVRGRPTNTCTAQMSQS